MNILITIDANYIRPFRVMLHSLFASNPDERDVTFYLLHSGIPSEKLEELEKACAVFGAGLVPLTVDTALFENAPTSRRYPKEMYYRLLSPHILPQNLGRILYLDPDILIINPIRELWELKLQGKIFAAASHTGITELTNNINFARLNIDNEYFNSGVMLMDLEKAREMVDADEIFRCVKENEKDLILPDQDVFNILYGKQTLAVDDAVWNYDVRHYPKYLMRSTGERDMSWVMQNTAILHFCGKSKPWKGAFKNPFGILYKHYMNLASKQEASDTRLPAGLRPATDPPPPEKTPAERA